MDTGEQVCNVAVIPCKPNPDVAGLGAVIAFLVSTILTSLLSAICAVINLSSHYARYNAEHGPQNQNLSTLLRPLFQDIGMARSVPSKSTKVAFWHNVIGQILEGLGLNQFVASLAIYTSALATYGRFSQDPHSQMACDLCVMLMMSQTAAPFVVPRPNRKSATFRSLAFMLFVPLTKSMANEASPSTNLGWVKYWAWIVAAIVTFLAMLMSLCLENRLADHHLARFDIMSLEPLRIPLVQIAAGLMMCGFGSIGGMHDVVRKRFMSQSIHCSLASKEENEWTLGQILSIFMLLGPILSAFDAYWEESERRKERMHASEATSDGKLELLEAKLDALLHVVGAPTQSHVEQPDEQEPEAAHASGEGPHSNEVELGPYDHAASASGQYLTGDEFDTPAQRMRSRNRIERRG